MPKLKSVIAGLAVSTALTGGMVCAGAATTAVSADAIKLNTSSILTGIDDDGLDDGLGIDEGIDDGLTNGIVIDRRDRDRHRRQCRRHHGWGGGWGGGWWGGRHRRGGEVCVVIRNDNVNDNRPERRRVRTW
ncbi:hypothetical protein ACFPOI_41570 [Nonomuraea angiospora]|uniref:Secreted protein n=1 Tax=Nonomuraea angiospora TaxID=46172 RepID=A0ABR9M3Q1_9ACTN|nr:hypothetical protein [Nonomuraea angiospora]MBE1587513.1 hypothetical protein [Nonomuraea angiospora]MDX3101244.1 hypothetical protein [Nonomuraea angiospora]